MLQALKAAFFLRYPVRGLGAVPFNAIGLCVFGLAGLANPGFWFAGAGLETLYLATLASNARFQRYAAGVSLRAMTDDVDATRANLLQQLPADDQALVRALSAKCARIESLWRARDEGLLAGNDRALRELKWAYLKLLIARQHVREGDAGASEATLGRDIERLEREAADPQSSAAARESKMATLELLRRRSANIGRRRQSLEEIESDLARVQTQIDLALENATLDGKPQEVSADLEVASRLLDDSYFGAAAADVAAVDAAYAARTPPARVSQ